jgi:hypothetical protein
VPSLKDTGGAAAVGRAIPVVYENDCNAAALWESFVGDPTGSEVMFLLAPGTGLGGGIVINGRLLRGARGMGAELGHVDIVHPPFVPGWQPSPEGTHWPSLQICVVALHALPQAPQLDGSELVSAQMGMPPPGGMQRLSPGRQAQAPVMHTWSEVHWVPQAPQLRGSLFLSTHSPVPQVVAGEGQTQPPLRQR